MMEIIKLNSKNREEVIEKTLSYISSGKTVVFPTDTVYGIICDATKKSSVEKIFKIKNRPRQKFFPVFVKDIKMAKKLAKIDKEKEEFLKKSWPGKITVILEKKTKNLYGVGIKTIAIRIPNYKSLNLLLNKINNPLSQTSANISKENPAKNAKEVFKKFNKQKYKPDLVVAGGFLKNKPSKIIDLTIMPPRILR